MTGKKEVLDVVAVKPLLWEKVEHPVAGVMYLSHCPLTGYFRAFSEAQRVALEHHRVACIVAQLTVAE